MPLAMMRAKNPRKSQRRKTQIWMPRTTVRAKNLRKSQHRKMKRIRMPMTPPLLILVRETAIAERRATGAIPKRDGKNPRKSKRRKTQIWMPRMTVRAKNLRKSQHRKMKRIRIPMTPPLLILVMKTAIAERRATGAIPKRDGSVRDHPMIRRMTGNAEKNDEESMMKNGGKSHHVARKVTTLKKAQLV
jgi:hypothetical protein